ncbi:MAG: SAP domain-containing protein [Oscillospiraceae bacterium]|nr:SAP domain-containing protein [Oscillospiraceae bacterium]
MSDRPELSRDISAEVFRNYYYLKEELVKFCRKYDLQTTGSKQELTDRIAYFLETGEKKKSSSKRIQAESIGEITENTLIEANIVCSEKHRAFFKERIGKTFSFNVAFQKWLKSNAGKTYADAIKAYYAILEEKKKSKTVIDKQFEYNTYIRDFFADNNGMSLENAIKCWKYKKSLKGHNRYEKTDLIALENEND